MNLESFWRFAFSTQVAQTGGVFKVQHSRSFAYLSSSRSWFFHDDAMFGGNCTESSNKTPSLTANVFGWPMMAFVMTADGR